MMVRDLWVARCDCNCRPFEWVKDLYEERRRIGSNTRGYPLKLGLNSLYGKMAQRCGRGPYHDAVAAGLITASTRARVKEAIGQDPESVIMLATDAVFSTRRLSLDIGEDLGQWEETVWPDLFIAQPGVYWSPSDLQPSVKSRGAPRSIIGEAAPRFHGAFTAWFEVMRKPGGMEATTISSPFLPHRRPSSRRAKAINRLISTNSSKFPKRTASRKSTKNMLFEAMPDFSSFLPHE
jgi:hypothetical protein